MHLETSFSAALIEVHHVAPQAEAGGTEDLTRTQMFLPRHFDHPRPEERRVAERDTSRGEHDRGRPDDRPRTQPATSILIDSKDRRPGAIGVSIPDRLVSGDPCAVITRSSIDTVELPDHLYLRFELDAGAGGDFAPDQLDQHPDVIGRRHLAGDDEVRMLA